MLCLTCRVYDVGGADWPALSRSGGKSSIRKVVFEGMAPSDTLFIERTNKSSTDDIK